MNDNHTTNMLTGWWIKVDLHGMYHPTDPGHEHTSRLRRNIPSLLRLYSHSQIFFKTMCYSISQWPVTVHSQVPGLVFRLK